MPLAIQIWWVLGGLVCFMCSPIEKEYWFAHLNPFWLHKNTDMDWFDAIVFALLFNAMCPPISLIYCFCKLICTIGRR